MVVHGRNAHENQPQSSQRRRFATRKIGSIAEAPNQPQALLWNPAGLSLEKAAEILGVWHGTAAILGGTEIFSLFLPAAMTCFICRVWRGCVCQAGGRYSRRFHNSVPRRFLPQAN